MSAIKKKNSGQILVFFALLLCVVMIVASFSINAGLLVNYKMKLQNVADLAAYVGASVRARVMASHMPETKLQDELRIPMTVARINEQIMEAFNEFADNVTNLNCSLLPLPPGVPIKCHPIIMASALLSPCDDNGNIAKMAFTTYYDMYEKKRFQLVGELLLLDDQATMVARKVAATTILHHLPSVARDEIIILTDKLFPDGTVGPAGSISDEVVSFCTLVNTATINPNAPTCIGTPIIAWPLDIGGHGVSGGPSLTPCMHKMQIKRRIFYSHEIHRTGSVTVGIYQRSRPTTDMTGNTFNSDDSDRILRTPFSKLNLSTTFGKESSPPLQAWASAAPLLLRYAGTEIAMRKAIKYNNCKNVAIHVLPGFTMYDHNCGGGVFPPQESVDLGNPLFYNLIPYISVHFIPINPIGNSFDRMDAATDDLDEEINQLFGYTAPMHYYGPGISPEIPVRKISPNTGLRLERSIFERYENYFNLQNKVGFMH